VEAAKNEVASLAAREDELLAVFGFKGTECWLVYVDLCI